MKAWCRRPRTASGAASAPGWKTSAPGSKRNTAAGRGIENVYIKDLAYTGTHAGTSLLIGLDANHVIKDITFENLVINGRVIRDSGGKPNW